MEQEILWMHKGDGWMWTRKVLKERAWQSLRATYWKAFLVSLLLALIGGGLPSCSANSGSGRMSDGFRDFELDNEFVGGLIIGILIIVFLIVIFVLVASLALRIFLISPLTVGVRKYFKQAARDDANMNHLGHAFVKGHYWPVVKGMLWKDFLNFLWFLLLIVPGIVKAYSYSLVPYLLADNPRLDMKRAVVLSRTMMRGHKWRTFVLDLSFLGWFILGTLALLVGTLFVLPYYNATKAELYLALREEAIRGSLTSEEELGLN